MKITRKSGLVLGIILAVLIAGAASARAQVVSPPARANCSFADGKKIDVHYSSPRMRGRKIFGGLVPFGEEWRVGADEATSFVNNVDLTAGGKTVPAGKYTLFALPSPTKWMLIISKKTGEWGIPYPGAQYDFARIEMAVSKISPPFENFTLAFDASGASRAMRLDWETTRASVEFIEKK